MISLTASALALVFGSAAAINITEDYFGKRMACTMKLDGSLVTGTSKGDGQGAPDCPEVETLLEGSSSTAACGAMVTALRNSGVTEADSYIKTFEITEDSIKNLGTRSAGYESWQPAGHSDYKWGRWVDPEHPMCGHSNFTDAAVACGTITSTMASCGPKYTKYDESKLDDYKGGKDHTVKGLYQLCGPHQTTACEDTMDDPAGALFVLLCGAALIIIFFQCSLMGLYDLLCSSKPEAGDGASAKATNQP